MLVRVEEALSTGALTAVVLVEAVAGEGLSKSTAHRLEGVVHLWSPVQHGRLFPTKRWLVEICVQLHVWIRGGHVAELS